MVSKPRLQLRIATGMCVVLISLNKTGSYLDGHCSSSDSKLESGNERCVYWAVITAYLVS
jgi:hypothetical protein